MGSEYRLFNPPESKIAELGICPAALEKRTNGANGGKNGGRACWVLSGTLCGNSVQGSFASKVINCQRCDVYQIVSKEEGPNFQSARNILKLIG